MSTADNQSKQDDRYQLRDEAGILTEDEITEEQRQSGKQANALILAMLRSEQAVDSTKPSFLPRIDAKRSNRVLLLDGGRGSGKTGLLITLVEMWRAAHVQNEGKDVAESKRPKLREGWTYQEMARVVPIGLLDLHPLPPSTNLLLHIVGRFERVVEWLEGPTNPGRESAPWHLAAGDELVSRKAWRHLLKAAATGWDGNVKERGAQLDLEAYVTEKEEAERQRLNLVDTFTTFVDALAKDVKERKAKASPLFVIAVDDADMDPSRSVELLTTVRMLWHPRLAFVLTGDSHLFLQTLAEHCLGELRKPLRGHSFFRAEIGGLAEERPVMRLARDIYDKIIPLGHRCRLLPIPRDARMQLSDDKKQEASTNEDALRVAEERSPAAELGDAFSRIRVDAGKDKEEENPTFASYFEADAQIRDALPDRLRGIIDLVDLARLELAGRPRGVRAPASHLIAEMWRRAVEISAEPIARYKEIVTVDEKTGALDVRDSEVTPDLDINTLLVAQSSPTGASPVVSFLEIDRIDAYSATKRRLEGPITATLMLASNVAFDQPGGTWNGLMSKMSGYEGYFANAESQLPDASTLTYLAWPLPRGYSLPFYAALSRRWKAGLAEERMNEHPFDVDRMAQRFLEAVIYLLLAKNTEKRKEVSLDWGSLAQGVCELLHRSGDRTRQWAKRRAGILAAPEYGLSAEGANSWLNALRDKTGTDWEGMCSDLDAERESRLTEARVAEPRLAMERLDRSCPDHAWRTTLSESIEDPMRPRRLLETFGRSADAGVSPESGGLKATPKAPRPGKSGTSTSTSAGRSGGTASSTRRGTASSTGRGTAPSTGRGTAPSTGRGMVTNPK